MKVVHAKEYPEISAINLESGQLAAIPNEKTVTVVASKVVLLNE